MSCCTFVIVYEGKIYYTYNHYNGIKEILERESPKGYLTNLSIYDLKYSDTGFLPAVIIDFDNKELINTSYNWFDDFKKYLPKDWTFKEFRAETCKQCDYILCKKHNHCKEVKR